MWRRNAGAMSTAKTLPFSPTAAANLRVNNPVPAPTSATLIPGLSLQAATMSLAWAAISRLSPSNFWMNPLTSGFSNGLLIPGRTLFSWAAVGSSAGKQTTRPATRVEKKVFMRCPFSLFPFGSGPSQIPRVGLLVAQVHDDQAVQFVVFQLRPAPARPFGHVGPARLFPAPLD